MSFIAGYLLGLGQGGKKPNIKPLSVTANGTYMPPSGVDGYSPVVVNIDDRYDEGYQDGFDFASSFYQNRIYGNRDYVFCIQIIDGSDYYGNASYPGSRRIRGNLYDRNDLTTLIGYYEYWVGNHPEASYDAVITNLHWGMSGNYEALFISTKSIDKYGNERNVTYTINHYNSMTHNNTSVINALPT